MAIISAKCDHVHFRFKFRWLAAPMVNTRSGTDAAGMLRLPSLKRRASAGKEGSASTKSKAKSTKSSKRNYALEPNMVASGDLDAMGFTANPAPLTVVLSDSKRRDSFANFLKTEYSSENLYFYKAATDLIQKAGANQLCNQHN